MKILLRAVSGLIVWAISFAALYGLQGLICSPRLSGRFSLLPYDGRELLVGIWLLFLGTLAWMAWRMWPDRQQKPVVSWLAPVLALTGLFAAFYTGLPVVFTTICH